MVVRTCRARSSGIGAVRRHWHFLPDTLNLRNVFAIRRDDQKAMDASHTLSLFLIQLILLMVVGRGLGEVMGRFGQPAIFGQLLGGVVLGPSVFGLIWPGAYDLVFPKAPTVKAMIDALSQVGILMLLLLTGMETNIRLVRRRFGTVAATSIAGIAVPFVCGVAVGYVLPDSLLPHADKRFVCALFIGTALSISSVKIVAMSLMEIGFIRRDLGQLILATAILDDTIAWVLLAVVAGLAAQGSVALTPIFLALASTAFFLLVAFTIGRRLTADVIRWTNDRLKIDYPVITAVLVITFLLALTTDLIGVHSALGAFVAGMLIGQSPILRGHIEESLRSMIMAFFSPIFFAVAGLGMDMRTLFHLDSIGFAALFIAVATFGKTLGALIGGRFGGLGGREALALATGLNARGSTEVIIASVGMSLGVLSEALYTMIVAMAILTTMAMPPTLRWALGRVQLHPEERERLEREEAEESDHLYGVERLLVRTDGAGSNTGLCLHLSGVLAADQQILTTVIGPAAVQHSETAREGAQCVEELVAGAAGSASREERIAPAKLISGRDLAQPEAVREEAAKGYGLVVYGLEAPFIRNGRHLVPEISAVTEDLGLPVVLAFGGQQKGRTLPRRILVPLDGTQASGLAAEIAISLARGCGAEVTFLHVAERVSAEAAGHGLFAQSNLRREAEALAKRYGVAPVMIEAPPAEPIVVLERMARSGGFDLVVAGSRLRLDGGTFLSQRIRQFVETAPAPTLLVLC